MKYLRSFNESNKPNFYEIIQKVDRNWSNDGMTSDAEDAYWYLVKKYGEESSDDIKKAIEDFYQTNLNL